MCNFTHSDLLFSLFEIYVKVCSAVVIYAVLSRDNFCCKFTHFLVENFQALKSASVKRRTNIRYDHVEVLIRLKRFQGGRLQIGW